VSGDADRSNRSLNVGVVWLQVVVNDSEFEACLETPHSSRHIHIDCPRLERREVFLKETSDWCNFSHNQGVADDEFKLTRTYFSLLLR